MTAVPRTRVDRISKRIGTWIGAGLNIATGYIWATHGVLTAVGFAVAVIVVSLAVLGALEHDWSTA